MKKFNTKAILAATMATTMVAIACGTAYADSNVDTSIAISETAELTDIGGYACYERDGNYWTVLDGEEYLVIDTRDVLAKASELVGTNNVQASIGEPTGWKNNTHISLPNGSSYTGNVYITQGDYYSPIFEVTPTMNDFRFKFDTDHILVYSYEMTFWYHFQSPLNQWHPETVKISFSGIPGYKIIMPGTMSGIIDGLGIEINSANSSQKDFKYTLTPM